MVSTLGLLADLTMHMQTSSGPVCHPLPAEHVVFFRQAGPTKAASKAPCLANHVHKDMAEPAHQLKCYACDAVLLQETWA